MDQTRVRRQRSDIQGARVDSFLYDEAGLQVLVHLECMVMYNTPRDYFEPDIIYYHRAHLQKPITVRQIEGKLHFFWSHWHRIGEKDSDWRKLYTVGLNGLPRLEKKWQDWVRDRAVILKMDASGTPRRLRSTFVLPRTIYSPARKIPSRSLAGNSISARVQKTQKSPQPFVARKFKTRLLVPANRRRTPNSSTTERISTVSISRGCSQSHCDEISEGENELVQSSRSCSSEQLCGRTGQDDFSQMRSKLDDLSGQRDRVVSELEDMRRQNSLLVSELEDLKSQKDEDTRYWEKLYRKAQEKQKSLKRNNKHLQAEYGIGQDQLGEVRLKLRSENDHLQERLDSYKATFQFKESEPFAENFQAQNVRKIVEHMDLLRMKVSKVLQGHDALLSIEGLGQIENSNISALFERSFDMKVNVNDLGENIITITKTYGTKLRLVVLGLLSAALSIWVFEAEVGALFQGNDLAYSSLRNLLAAQNEKVMHSFEFAAHEKCINDPFIRDKVIPRRARKLSKGILDCTIPLLDAHRSLDEEYVAIADEWLDANQQLTEIFEQALYAKVRLLLSTDVYKCSIYVPGTTFDSDSMQNIAEHDGHSTKSERDRVVAVTILPGLIRYASKENSFNYNRFLTGKAASKGPKGIKGEVLKKAVVLMR